MTKEETLQFMKLVNANFPISFEHLKGNDESRNMIASQWYLGFKDYSAAEVMRAFHECLADGLGNYNPSLGEIYGKILDKAENTEMLIETKALQVKQIGTGISYDPRIWSEKNQHPTHDYELQKELEKMLEEITTKGDIC